MKYIINAKFLSQKTTGTQQVGIGISRQLKKIGANNFITTNSVIHNELATEIEAVEFGKSNGILWEQLELPIFLKRNGNPLLIDFGNTAPVSYYNKITTILDLSPLLHPEWFSLKSKIYLSFIISSYIKNSKKIIAISEYTKKTIIDNFKINENQVEVIYPACPQVFFDKTSNLPTGIDSRYILAVSSIDPRKNFKSLIKAFIYANLKDVKLVIVGSESNVFADHNLKELIGDNKSIIFTGYINETSLINLYRQALFFIYPSFFEGFGIPPLEAMACGCPTIVSNVTSLPEACGNASVYINPYEIDSLVEAIKLLYNNENLRNDLKERGYKQAQSFSWTKSAQSLMNIINQEINV